MVRRRGLVLLLSALFLVALGSQIPLIRFENSSESYLQGDDPAAVRYDEFREQFGQDDAIVIALTPPAVFDADFLAWLRELHGALEDEVPFVTEVISLVNARRTRGEADVLIVEELMADWPETPEALAALRRRVMENPLYLDNLVSRDGRTTTLTVRPDLYAAVEGGDVLEGWDDGPGEGAEASQPALLSTDEKEELVAALTSVLARHQRPDVEVHVVGAAVTVSGVNDMMRADIEAYARLAVTVIVVFLYVLFRRVSGVLLPMAVVCAGLASTLGCLVLLDIPFSMTLGMIPIFAMTVGVCTAVHVLVAVYDQIGTGRPMEEAVPWALRRTGVAIAMASATTAVGMLSFTTAEIAPLRHLGLVAPVVVLFAFAFSMTLLPALLASARLRARVRGGKRAEVTISERLLAATGVLAVRHSRVVVASGLVLVVFLGFGAARLRFAHDRVSWFPEDHPLRLAIEKVDEVMRGSTTAEVLIDTGRENGLHDPDTLRRIESAMQAAEAIEVDDIFVGKALSIVDIVKESHEALIGRGPEHRVIPDSRDVVAQELLLFESSGSDDVEDFTDSRFRLARLSLRLPETDAVAYQKFLPELGSALGASLGSGIDYVVTGRMTLEARALSALITGMSSSYVVALVVITPLMILLIGEVRLGLISMAPNLFPVIFVLGLMGWLGIPLDGSNVIIGCVMIGLAVDDTIHFLHAFRREFEETGEIEEAVRRTMRVTGSALFFTSLVLCAGFLIMALRGSMLNTVYFGALTALGIAVAFVADVVATPALIRESLRGEPRPPAPRRRGVRFRQPIQPLGRRRRGSLGRTADARRGARRVP